MLTRFTGPGGAANVRTALLLQHLVQNELNLADRFIAVGELVEFSLGAILVEQDAVDTAARRSSHRLQPHLQRQAIRRDAAVLRH